MSQILTEASATIKAPPEQVYAILADYRIGHPAILPKEYFHNFTVEAGGVGAGTIITVQMVVLGVERTFRLVVSEPEPGRVLMEVDAQAGSVTTFVVDPLANGRHAQVTIRTETSASFGFTGMIESVMIPLTLRPIYQQELKLLADYVHA